ncbi:MAG: hypothetical protein RIS64_1646 [Bacteroidota bacterium]|jgi:hypothetical protein
MAAILPNLIKKGFTIHLKGISPSFKHKIEIISYHFETLEAFLNAQKADFESIRFIGGNQMIKLSAKDYEKIESFQASGLLDVTLSIEQNFIRLLTNHFLKSQDSKFSRE